MKRPEDWTPEERQRIRAFINYLFDESDNGFDAEWDTFVIETYRECGCNMERTLTHFPDPEDHAEVRAVIHIWEQRRLIHDHS